MPRRVRFIDLADQEKVAAAPLLIGERGMRFDQEHVAGVQDDIADLLVQPLAIAGDGDDDGVVVAAKARVADRHADQRAGIADDGFDQAPLRPRRLEVKHVFGRRDQAANALQLDDRFDDADKQQPVAAAQHFARRDGGYGVAVAVDLGEEQAAAGGGVRRLRWFCRRVGYRPRPAFRPCIPWGRRSC